MLLVLLKRAQIEESRPAQSSVPQSSVPPPPPPTAEPVAENDDEDDDWSDNDDDDNENWDQQNDDEATVCTAPSHAVPCHCSYGSGCRLLTHTVGMGHSRSTGLESSY